MFGKCETDYLNIHNNSIREKEILKNYGIRDFLKYKKKKQSKLPIGLTRIINFDGEENYRSKSAKFDVKKEIFNQSIKNNIENNNSNYIEKARANIKIIKLSESKKLTDLDLDNGKIINIKNKDIYNNNINSKINHHIKNEDNMNYNLDNLRNKNNERKKVNFKNDIFSDEDFKFIEMSKSQKKKINKLKEQTIPMSNYSNDVEYNPTAHFNITKSVINLNLSKNKIEEDKDKIYLRFYEDEFDKITNIKSNSNNKDFNLNNSEKYIFGKNLLNENSPLNINHLQNNNKIDDIYNVNNYDRGNKNSFDNYNYKTSITPENNKEKDELLKTKSNNINVGNEIVISENNSHLDSKLKTNSDYLETFRKYNFY